MLMIVAGISFPSIGKKFHVAGATPSSSKLHKHITVQKLLELADTELSEVKDTGCGLSRVEIITGVKENKGKQWKTKEND